MGAYRKNAIVVGITTIANGDYPQRETNRYKLSVLHINYLGFGVLKQPVLSIRATNS